MSAYICSFSVETCFNTQSVVLERPEETADIGIRTTCKATQFFLQYFDLISKHSEAEMNTQA